MTFPTGVLTRQVIVHAPLGLSGQVLHGSVQVEIAGNLKWEATGDLILDVPETVFLDTNTGLGEITLPIIQQGFVGPDGVAVQSFTYTFTPLLNPNVPVVSALNLELGFGDGTPVTISFDAPDPNQPGIVLQAAGPAGADGQPGAAGPPPNLTIGVVSTGTPGSAAAATVSGVAPNYQLNFTIPSGQPGIDGSGQGVPVGGTAGQVLAKIDATNYNTQWINNVPVGVPVAGTAGQILAKIDGTNYNTQWVAPPVALPPAGATGQVLTKNSGANQDAGWADVPVVHELPGAGTVGQVLAKTNSTDYAVQWITPAAGGGTGLPNGGTAGQFLKKNSVTNGDASWADPVFSIATLPAWTTLTVIKDPISGWPARPTARTDLVIRWKGADPSPAIVSSGTGGMLDNVDERVVTP